MQSSTGLTQGHKRNPRACENCRERRVRCSGQVPCEACRVIGLGDTCEVRVKTRPKRVPRIAITTQETLPRSIESWKFTNFVVAVEKDLARWAEDRALSDVFPVRQANNGDVPPIPPLVDSERLSQYLDISVSSPYLAVMPPERLYDILRRYNNSDGGTVGLGPEELALLYASFCVGSHALSRTGGVPTQTLNEQVIWLKLCLIQLDSWGGASKTALIALHFLHNYVLQSGGIIEVRDIMMRMAIQVRRLGVEILTEDEYSARLFYAIIYKDSWYGTICGSPPFLDAKDYMARLSSIPADTHDLDRGPVAVPLVMQLTEFENELTSLLHQSPTSSSGIGLTSDYITRTSLKWGDWLKTFRESQSRPRKPMLYVFATIRFHWLQLLLHYPLIDSPAHYESSSAVVARAVCPIIGSYFQSATDMRYTASWPDVRRIVTSGQIVLLLYSSGEFQKDEAETLLGKVRILLQGLGSKYPMAVDADKCFVQLIQLSDLYVPSPATPVQSDVVQPALASNAPSWDSLPLPDDWLWDLSNASFPTDWLPSQGNDASTFL